MISLVRFEKSVADSILSSALDTYPRETILLMRGKAEGDEILINDLVIPPLARHGLGFSGFPNIMLPLDLKVMGVSHSHPSGTLRPSIQDLNHFYGKIMVIAAYPFQSYDDIGAFNSHGDKLQHQIVPDHEDLENR
ncbi:MAG TPA: Mov34/MPN/PAD-1 family protein [Candidatus Bathyarchaeia archaeon]|nr:Mov34/MPN/PAD-1 family protein [Candidatus Bathyarchaeia archaeon]